MIPLLDWDLAWPSLSRADVAAGPLAGKISGILTVSSSSDVTHSDKLKFTEAEQGNELCGLLGPFPMGGRHKVKLPLDHTKQIPKTCRELCSHSTDPRVELLQHATFGDSSRSQLRTVWFQDLVS